MVSLFRSWIGGEPDQDQSLATQEADRLSEEIINEAKLASKSKDGGNSSRRSK